MYSIIFICSILFILLYLIYAGFSSDRNYMEEDTRNTD
jgi:hypothetical protein